MSSAEPRDQDQADGAPAAADAFSTLFDRTSEPALVSTLDGIVSRANAAAGRLLRTDPGRRLPGSRLADLFDGPAGPTVPATVEAGLARTGSWSAALVHRGAGGVATPVDVRVTGAVVDGLPCRLWLMARSGRDGPGETSLAEARLALGLAAGRMAIWDFDVATDHLTGSPDLYALLGFPPGAEPTTEEIRERYCPGERRRLQDEGRAAMARGDTFVESEFRVRWPDGSVHWLLLRAQSLRDASGRPARALGVAMDITERKSAEEAVRSGETRLRLAREASGIGVWDWDLDRADVAWSPENLRALGLDPTRDAPPRLRTWLRALHPDDRAGAVDALRRAAREGRAFSIDLRLEGEPGAGPRWIRSRGAPVEGWVGRPSRFVGVNVDVTDERRRERRLSVLAEDLRGAVASAERERDRVADLTNDLFAAVDRDGGLRAVNPAWKRLLGDDGRDLRGSPYLALLHEEDRDIAAAALSELRGGAVLRRFETRLARRDLDVVWVAWAATSEAGTVYAVGRDVTMDRARDAALGQAQKMEALGQLTGGIAHDFNNLLQAVVGYLELVRANPADPVRVTRWADNALLAGQRGTRLTGQLLSFSRAEAIRLAAVPVGDVLAGLDDLLRRTLGSGTRVGIDVPPEPLAVVADRTQLETALVNLAVNARDAMSGGGVVTIEARPRAVAGDVELPPGDYVEIRVGDTGTGMPSHVVARAFDPFFTTKGVGRGTGLGLSQVYGMARHAGGTARIDSRPGRGTTVTLVLRRTDRQAETSDGADAPVEPERDRRGTVLVVDDDPDVRSLLADMLGALGYRVSTADDGPAALLKLEGEVPDVMLLDFAMPGMDGAEVARRASSRHPGLPVVLATGNVEAALLAPDVSALPKLRKPFHMGELAETLSRLFAERPREP